MKPKSRPLIDRRAFVKGAGALGLGMASGALPAGLASYGQGEAITPFLLMIHVSGGWDPTMVFDPKLDSPFCAKEAGAALAVGSGGQTYVDHASRPAVKSFFTDYGANAAIVNGLSIGSMTRRGALVTMLGTTPPGKLRPVDWLSFYTASLNPVLEIPHAVINAPYMPGDYAGVAVRLTTDRIKQAGTALAGADPLGETGEAALTQFRSTSYTRTLEAAGENLDGEKMRALYYGQAREPLVEARLVKTKETLGPAAEGESDFIRNGKIAVELFASGASLCATLQHGEDGAWDTRADHYARASLLYEDLFRGINAIMAHANATGIAGRMILLVVSDGGRSPQLNTAQGKGPWGFTSTLLWGPGIAPGMVIGSTDAALRGLPINPMFGSQIDQDALTVEMANVMAAIYVKTNVPVKLILPDTKPLSLVLTSE